MQYATRAARALLGATAHPGGTALTRHLLDVLGLPPGTVPAGTRVLDVACGDGATLRLLGPAGVGVDVEPDAVRRAGSRAVVGDALALPLASGSCDAVLVECALSTVTDPARVLAEVVRVLRPGGLLGMTDVVLDRDRADPVVVEAVDRITGARTVGGYQRLLADAGLLTAVCEERPRDALALVRRVRRRLALVGARRAARTAAACEAAVRDGSLGYVLLTARRP